MLRLSNPASFAVSSDSTESSTHNRRGQCLIASRYRTRGFSWHDSNFSVNGSNLTSWLLFIKAHYDL
jgi:hypothetical protein